MCQTFIILLRAGPQNDARLKPVRSANKVADSCSRGQHYTALRFLLLLMFIENCLVNNCLIMITAKANVFLSLLKFIDADW